MSNTSQKISSPTLFSNNLPQRSSPTLLYNTSLQDFSRTLFSKTSLQHSVKHPCPTLLENSLLRHSSLQHFSPTRQHFSTTLLCNTYLQHFSATLLYNTSLQHSPPTLLYSTLLQHFSATLLSTTLLYNTLVQHSSPTIFFNTLLQHFSATLLYNTSLQHSCPTLFSHNLLQHSSATLLCNTSLQSSLQYSSPTLVSTTLLYNTSLQHFSATLLYNTFVQHSSPTIFFNTLLQRFSPTLLYNTSLQHFSTTRLSNTLLPQSSSTLFCNASLQHFSTTIQHLSTTVGILRRFCHFSSTSQIAVPATTFDTVSSLRRPDTAIHQNSTCATSQNAAPTTNCKTHKHNVLRLPLENDTAPLKGFQSIAPATQHANIIATHVTVFGGNPTPADHFCRILLAPPNGRELTQYRGRRRTAADGGGRQRTQDPPSANTVQPPDPQSYGNPSLRIREQEVGELYRFTTTVLYIYLEFHHQLMATCNLKAFCTLSSPRYLTHSNATLQGTNISHLGKRKIIFKSALGKGYDSSQEGTLMGLSFSTPEVYWPQTGTKVPFLPSQIESWKHHLIGKMLKSSYQVFCFRATFVCFKI